MVRNSNISMSRDLNSVEDWQRQWELKYERDQFITKTKFHHIQSQMKHLRFKLIMAEVEIYFWKDKVNSQEDNHTMSQGRFQSEGQVQNLIDVDNQLEVLEVPETSEKNDENVTGTASTSHIPSREIQKYSVSACLDQILS